MSPLLSAQFWSQAAWSALCVTHLELQSHPVMACALPVSWAYNEIDEIRTATSNQAIRFIFPPHREVLGCLSLLLTGKLRIYSHQEAKTTGETAAWIQSLALGFLNQFFSLIAMLRQPLREVVRLVEERPCQFFERIGLRAQSWHPHKARSIVWGFYSFREQQFRRNKTPSGR